MHHSIKTLAACCAFTASIALSSTAFSAEPLVGKWKRDDGTIIQYSGSGTRYCAKVVNGQYAGKSIGCMTGKGKSYKGKLKVLSEGKTYTGYAKVSGNRLNLKGCVVWPACKSATLVRQ